MLLNFDRDIIRVTIEYKDKPAEVFDIGPDQGFLRESYTYEQNKEGSDKVTAILHCYEIYWVERKEAECAYDFRVRKASGRVS